MKALLAAGAKHSTADTSFLDMKTPLHKAAGQGHRDVCVALMEAGADPNTRDAAGNSALDVLDQSSPVLSNAALLSTSDKGGGGGGAEECSTVVLSRGGKQDWGGVREALERYGGYRNIRGDTDARDDGGHTCDGGDGDGVVSARGNPCASSGGGLEEAGPEQESVGVLPPIASAPREAVVAHAGVGVEGSDEPLAEPTSNTLAGDTASEVGDALAAPAPVSSQGELASTPRSDPGSMRAGIPCGECLLPKMVMVRASCCGGLVCKPCVRDMCARRHSCRRCRDSSAV